MKNKVTLLVLLTTLCEVRAELFLVDKIECVVCGPERNTPLTNTDESIKKDMSGQSIPMAQLIQNDVVSQQIIADKVPIDPTAADKYVETLKKQNNLTDTDLADMFEQIGRTYLEGIALLNEQYYHEFFTHYKFKSQQIATDVDIQKYYDEHPAYVDGSVKIEVAYVDFDEQNRDAIKKDLDLVERGKEPKSIEVQWSSPIEISLQDIAQDKKFIFDMNQAQVAVHETQGSFELYKLLEKVEPKIKSLEEVRSTIVDRLNRNKLEKMLEDYNQEVRKFIDIINLNEQ